MRKCCVKDCSNDSDVTENTTILYLQFPSKEEKKSLWLAVINFWNGPDYDELEEDARVCSCHFLEGDFQKTIFGYSILKSNALPSVRYPCLDSVEPEFEEIEEFITEYVDDEPLTGEIGVEATIKMEPVNEIDQLEIAKSENDKKFMCGKCGKFFDELPKFRRHKRTHYSDKYACTVCDKKFSELQNKKMHEITHLVDKPLKCEYCEKSFCQKINYETHIRTHTGEKPYHCPDCNRSYASKSALEYHKYSEHGIYSPSKHHECAHCGKRYIYATQLAVHMRTHTKEKPFACDICSKKFLISNHLVVHMRTHTGERPYICGTCKKSFKRRYLLKVHERLHTGEKNYECGECGRRYVTIGILNKHKKKHEKPTFERKAI